MTKLESMTIGFENVDVAVVPAEYISGVLVHGIHAGLYITGSDARVMRYQTSDQLTFFLKDNAANIETAYGEKLFERINKWKDITSVELRYDDGTVEEIGTPWIGPDSQENLAQMCEERDGELKIEIFKREEC